MAHSVLIAGAGPTGLTAALELSRMGVAVRLIDRLPAPVTTSRAIGVQARTLELMRQRGLVDEMVRLGHCAPGTSIYGGGKRVVRMDFAHVPSRYKHVLLLSQAETERILREAAVRQGVSIERGVELVGVSQDAQSCGDVAPVQATLRHAEDGRLELAEASWLISAEGAHSRVRGTLDLRFEGATLNNDYALGDMALTGDVPETDIHIFSSDHGFVAMFPLGSGRFRMIASAEHGAAKGDGKPSLVELQRFYDERSHLPARFGDLRWSSWFRINSRMVPRLRAGRLLLGGDSAHIHSPAGGQGMNTGMQDMVNLCWKLALVVRGAAPDALLDTYEGERLPVMRHVLTRSEKLTEVMESENRFVRSLFNHLGPWIGGSELVQDRNTALISQVAIGYRDSALSSQHRHGGTVRAGDRLPDLRVRCRGAGDWADMDLLDALDPSRFVLLVKAQDDGAAAEPALHDTASAFGDLVATREMAAPIEAPAAAQFKAAFGEGAGAFLVRPDGYLAVATDGDTAPRRLAAYRERWLTPGKALLS